MYYVIDTVEDSLRVFDDANRAGSFLLGRRVREYIIVKNDSTGQRVVSFDTSDVNKIIDACNAA